MLALNYELIGTNVNGLCDGERQFGQKEVKMLNTDILKGKWKELKGDIKVKWGKLTDDDLTEIEGNTEKFVGILQKRYGYSRDEAEREYNEFIDRYQKRAA